jgi:hypothetical protein
MGILQGLFNSKKVVDTAADGIYNGVDKLFYTKEEKAQATQRGLELYLEFIKATQPAALARRYLMFILSGLWAFLILLTVVLQLMGAAGSSEFVFKMLTDVVAVPFGMAVAFYFLKHVTSNLKQ